MSEKKNAIKTASSTATANEVNGVAIQGNVDAMVKSKMIDKKTNFDSNSIVPKFNHVDINGKAMMSFDAKLGTEPVPIFDYVGVFKKAWETAKIQLPFMNGEYLNPAVKYGCKAGVVTAS